ncbi:MAG: hypothetical protein GTO17_05415 [Candidatus Aminicenantes bacterium]|nr:hypothetical protein [Candidatus Aminicenantes bacterium]
MDKEEALKEFFKGLKVSLKNASLYFNQHPLFLKSLEEVKENIDLLFNFSSPIRINFTPNSLLVDGEFFEGDKVSEELAELFHSRKVKSLEIRKGIAVEELVAFLTSAQLPPRDILRKGGLNQILDKESIPHLSVEELDYSPLLKDEGEEVEDLWVHLFQEAVEAEDYQRINEFVENFENIIGRFELKDLLEDKELQENIAKFLTHLKDRDKDKLRKCLKDLLRSLVRNKDSLNEASIEKLKVFFADKDVDDIAYALMEEIVTDEQFDSLSFNLFSLLLEKEKHRGVAVSLADIFRERESALSDDIREKIKEVLTDPSSPDVSEIYRKSLASFLKDISLEGEFAFDRGLLHKNYRYILLSLFDTAEKKEEMSSLLERITEDWEAVTKDKDFEYLKELVNFLEARKEDLSSEPYFEKLDKQISLFIENTLLDERMSPDIEYFIGTLKESHSGHEVYLDKIFNENKTSPLILRLFSKFFPDQYPLFQKGLRGKFSHPAFMHRIMESLKTVDTTLSLNSLKYIFSFGSPSVRVKALKAMQELSLMDEDFLNSILKQEDWPLKKEALLVLKREPNAEKKAADMLLTIPSPFGLKNKILEENIRIILEAGLGEARDHLLRLSKKRFFWNKNLRMKAREALSKINDRKS